MACWFDICCDYIWRNTMRVCCGLPCCNFNCPCCSTNQCQDWTFSCTLCQPELDEDFEIGQQSEDTQQDNDIVLLSSHRNSSNRPAVYTCQDLDQLCEQCCQIIFCKICCKKRNDSMNITKLSEEDDNHAVFQKSPTISKRSSRNSNLYPRSSNGSTLLISKQENSIKRGGSLRGSVESETKDNSLKGNSTKTDITTVRMHDIIQHQESVDETGIAQKITVEAIIEQPKARLSADDKGLANSPVTEESQQQSADWKSQELKVGSDDEDSKFEQVTKQHTEIDTTGTNSNQHDGNSEETNISTNHQHTKLARSMDSFEFKKYFADSDTSDNDSGTDPILSPGKRPKDRNSREEFSDVRISGVSIIVTDFDVEESIINSCRCTSLESLTDSNVGSENSYDQNSDENGKTSRKTSIQDFIKGREVDGFTLVGDTENVLVSPEYKQTSV